jgi:formylglycine-generating enzyme required for sulfatase activity
LGEESLVWVSPSDGMTLIGIPAGGFWMGSGTDDAYAEPDEMPLRRIHLDAYWIDRTEVTNAMFAQCVRAGACQPPPSAFGPFSPPAYFGSGEFNDSPVVNVSQAQAQEYCTWAGRRLPTEAEAAARDDRPATLSGSAPPTRRSSTSAIKGARSPGA